MNHFAYEKRLGVNEYINSGVLFMNIENVNNLFSYDKLVNKLKQILEDTELIFPDQDAINLLYQNEIIVFPEKFNYQKLVNKGYCLKHSKELKDVVIAHFVSTVKR